MIRPRTLYRTTLIGVIAASLTFTALMVFWGPSSHGGEQRRVQP